MGNVSVYSLRDASIYNLLLVAPDFRPVYTTIYECNSMLCLLESETISAGMKQRNHSFIFWWEKTIAYGS